jgi:hypothetical protein
MASGSAIAIFASLFSVFMALFVVFLAAAKSKKDKSDD